MSRHIVTSKSAHKKSAKKFHVDDISLKHHEVPSTESAQDTIRAYHASKQQPLIATSSTEDIAVTRAYFYEIMGNHSEHATHSRHSKTTQTHNLSISSTEDPAATREAYMLSKHGNSHLAHSSNENSAQTVLAYKDLLSGDAQHNQDRTSSPTHIYPQATTAHIYPEDYLQDAAVIR